ncbi:MAG TPA: hypothetical protein PLO90_00155 [Clostridia bacterium]|nr:hypothetical protein [Clostridia bacterium]HPY42765.1 hypothetical protein [Clostridia bacterium]HQA96591.1 hypothetical protein [Clostridia bacterium]HQO54738.1 hypothetical protein [Clostridia bacterium]HUM61127.1 hypothetical protein [Clostridia bacterium]
MMKQGSQLRIYLNNIDNCPQSLKPYLGVGTGRFVKRINKGKFVEKIVKYYGFMFGDHQNSTEIRHAVMRHHPSKTIYFDKGYSL